MPENQFDEGDLDALAELYRRVHYESRRSGKRYLHETGLTHCTAAQLDAVLALIAAHPVHDQIVDLAEKLQAARLREEDRTVARPDLPEWLIGEVPHWGRTFLIHFCPGGSCSFCGEVFDTPEESPADLESYPLDAGQTLGNITWLEGRPSEETVAQLMAEARRQLRVYDAGSQGDTP
jgi:hypothetical protein